MKGNKKLKKIDNYYVNTEHELGTGTYATVYSGFDSVTGEIIAVKQISIVRLNSNLEQMSNQLKNEIRNMKAVSHKNIVKLLDLKKSAHNLYLVMEHCNNGHLEHYLKINNGHLSEGETLRIMGHILLGYKCLYENKIVHRDIKPANILLHNDIPKLSDFGFSKAVDDSISDHNFDTKVGSPQYMSPQILQGKSYTCKTDVWSLGMMFYQMLFKKFPWVGRHQNELFTNITTKPLEFPEEIVIQEKTKSIITAMLKENEEDRISWESLFNEQLFMAHDKEQEALIKQIQGVEGSALKGFAKAYNLNKMYFRFNRVVRSVFDSFRRKEFHEKNFNFGKAQPAGEGKGSASGFTPTKSKTSDPAEIFKTQEKEALEIEVSQKIGRCLLQRRNKSVLYNRLVLLVIKNLLLINEEEVIEKPKIEIIQIVYLCLSYQLYHLRKLIDFLHDYETKADQEIYKNLHKKLTDKYLKPNVVMFMESKYRSFVEQMLLLDENTVNELFTELKGLIGPKELELLADNIKLEKASGNISWTPAIKELLKSKLFSFYKAFIDETVRAFESKKQDLNEELLVIAILLKEVSGFKKRLNIKNVDEVDFFKYWENLERMKPELLLKRFRS